MRAHRRFTSKLVPASAALALVVGASLGASPAGAAPDLEPAIEAVGKVKLEDDGTATVKARYICSGGDWHLWVSAKQSADGSVDPAITQENSGAGHVAAAWLQSHPTTFECDGVWHTQKFQIDTAEQGYGELIEGQAWVQLCLIDGAAGLFLADMRWTRVH